MATVCSLRCWPAPQVRHAGTASRRAALTSCSSIVLTGYRGRWSAEKNIELISPDDPLAGHPLTLSADELVVRYESLRANVRPGLEGRLRYLIVTREDEQTKALATVSDLTHVEVPDPDGALLNAAARARRNFNRHAARTDEPLIPAGPMVDELVNGYRRPGAPPDRQEQ